MTKRSVKIFLNPNPGLRGETLVDPHGRRFGMINDPFIAVELFNYPKGEYNVALQSPLCLTKKINISEPYQIIYLLDRRLADPLISKAKVVVNGRGYNDIYTQDIGFHSIKGLICDYNKKPRQAYIWFGLNTHSEHKIVVRSDKKGKYRIYLPKEKRVRVFINDLSYGKSTLECWIMAQELKNNVTIDPVIGGRFEFYELKAWHFDNIWNIFFLPAVVDAPIPSLINKKDLKISINGQKAKILKFTPHKVFFKGKTKGIFYPAYIIAAATEKPVPLNESPALIHVQLNSKKLGKGEAWYIYNLSEG
jgi:hypothetical protein